MNEVLCDINSSALVQTGEPNASRLNVYSLVCIQFKIIYESKLSESHVKNIYDVRSDRDLLLSEYSSLTINN